MLAVCPASEPKPAHRGGLSGRIHLAFAKPTSQSIDMAKLTFVLEDGQEVVVPLTDHLTIGRAEGNDVVVDDERLSAHHAELVQNADGSLQVFDLKSTAGTFVNDQRIVSHTLLHGDRLTFGPLSATFALEEGAAPAAPPSVVAAVTPSMDAADIARLEEKKTRLQAQVDAAEKELRDWEQRAEKERALHSARVESLCAEEERLAPIQAAVHEATDAHQQWLDVIHTLTSQHAEKTTALEQLNAQHVEKSTEVQRLATAATTARQEVADLDAQTQQRRDRLKQVRDECEQDETLLNSLRQQVIEMEQRLQEGQTLAAKHAQQLQSTDQRRLELDQRLQELASAEKQRAGKLASETQRLAGIQAQRAALEAECQELADTQRQLADTRQRLAAVEKRYRAVQEDHATGSTHGDAAPRRKATREQAPSETRETDTVPTTASPSEHLSDQFTTARTELATLEARITTLREQAAAPPAAAAFAESATGIPAPRIIQVDTVLLRPVGMKSESTHIQSGAAVPAPAKGKTR